MRRRGGTPGVDLRKQGLSCLRADPLRVTIGVDLRKEGLGRLRTQTGPGAHGGWDLENEAKFKKGSVMLGGRACGGPCHNAFWLRFQHGRSTLCGLMLC